MRSFLRNAPVRTAGRTHGFTLIELMVTVAIVGILAAIALPSYSEYVTRSRLLDAHAKLADLRAQMERYYMDNRTYRSGTACGIDDAAINMTATYNADGGRSFTMSCVAASATTYTITATGMASKGMTGFTFTVNQANAKTAVGPSPWPTTATTCWFVRKNGDCT